MATRGFPAGGWVAGVVGLLLIHLSGCDLRPYFEKPEKRVYVVASALNMRKEPSRRSQILKRLARGEELETLDKDGVWLKVKAVDGVTGWVHEGYVGDPAAVRKALELTLGKRPRWRLARRSGPAADGGEALRSSEDPTRLNVSIEEMLAGLSDDIEIEELDDVEGEGRLMGASSDGQVVVEFWGDHENLSRASLTASVVDVSQEEFPRNAEMMVRFIRNAVPRWDRDYLWMMGKLLQLTSREAGKGGFDADGKAVRFEFVKALGSVRATITSVTAEP